MQVVKGMVGGVKVVLDAASLPEGTEVAVVVTDQAGSVRLPPHLLSELNGALDEADRGEGMSAEELFAELRKYG